MRYIKIILLFFCTVLIVISCSTDSSSVYELTTSSLPSDAGSVKPAQGEYNGGVNIELLAVPNEGWKFEKWQGEVGGSENPLSLVVDQNYDIIAIFSRDFEKGLVAHYPFNGNANDISGNEKHGTIIGVNPTVDRFGENNNAFFFDGIDDRISIGNVFPNIGKENDEISISLWIKTDSGFNPEISENGKLISDYKRQGDCCERTFLAQLELILTESDNQIIRSRTSFDGNSYNIEFNLNYSTNAWVHVVVTMDGIGTKRMYINGDLVGSEYYDSSVNYSLQNPPWEPDWQIGAEHWNDGRFDSDYHQFYQGVLDEVRIYERLLDSSEIRDLYNYEN